MNDDCSKTSARRDARAVRAILLHVEDAGSAEVRVRVARAAAQAFGGADVRAVHAVSPMLWRYPYALSSGADAVAALHGVEIEQGAAAHRAVVAAAEAHGPVDWIDATGTDPVSALALRSMYADLAIIGRPDPALPSIPLPHGFAASFVVAAGCPVLVLPPPAASPPALPMGRRVLVAWKETPEAARSVVGALPWLARADEVHVVGWQAPGSTAGGVSALTHRLRAHGIEPAKHYRDGDPKDVGAELMALAGELDADLIVMGCYGHSRVREWVMGGTTATMLASCPLPMLMAH